MSHAPEPDWTAPGDKFRLPSGKKHGKRVGKDGGQRRRP